MFKERETIEDTKLSHCVIPFAKASGIANDYKINIDGLNEYYEGLTICVQINETNTDRYKWNGKSRNKRSLW